MRGLILAAIAAGTLAFTQPCIAGPELRVDAESAGTREITVASRSGQTERITLALGKAAVVKLDTDARDVLVSDPAVVDAVVRTPRRIFLLAQKIGQTNAFFFDGAGHQVLSVDIRVERDTTDLMNAIHADFPDSNVRVTALSDNLVLTGTVANAQDAARVQDLAAQFIRDPGKAIDPTKIVNMLKIGGHEQVLLKVRVAEMERQIAKQFGINLSAMATAGGVPIIAATSNPYGLMGQALSSASGVQIGNVGTPGAPGPNNMQGVLNALEQTGLLHTLAEPNLTAVSGETAKFLAGGEFPVPAGRDQEGNISIIFKDFGVGLSFTPVVLSDKRISLQLSTEVSELTNTGAFTLAGGSYVSSTGQILQVQSQTIPALEVRRAESTVELPSGGSFAIAGLLQHTTKQVLDAFPGLKDMPVLGALFRSRDFENDETELVIIVSAYLVEPTTARKLASPTDGFVAPSDAGTIAFGRLNRSISTNDPNGLKQAGDSKVGFIVE
ncbi:MAG TPA: type II and III secretion system protein family protein [Rhizomicrobium sp.]|nr:type II and III secretion system protein family protein [Rhizomicrobium sp.]